jgi:RNA polymerase sigma-70 factor, ECF subfamily
MQIRPHEPEYWLDRAAEARAQAKDMITPEARREMLLIAAGYQRVAEHAERTAGKKSPPNADDFREQMIALLPRLSVFALCLMGNLEQSDDLVQETCARALACKDQWQPGARLDAWMFRVAHSLWFDRKRGKRARSEPFDIDHPVGSDVVRGSRLVLADLLAALEQLSLEHRAMIALVCVDGLSYNEAAEILNQPVGTVMNRLARGRLALNEAIDAAATSKAVELSRLDDSDHDPPVPGGS